MNWSENHFFPDASPRARARARRASAFSAAFSAFDGFLETRMFASSSSRPRGSPFSSKSASAYPRAASASSMSASRCFVDQSLFAV